MISCQGCQGSHFRQRLLATRGAARLTQWNRRLLLLQLGMDPAQNFVNFGQVAFFRVRPVKNFKWLPIRQTKDSMKHESDRGSSCSWAWTRLKTLAKLPSCMLAPNLTYATASWRGEKWDFASFESWESEETELLHRQVLAWYDCHICWFSQTFNRKRIW